MRRENEKGRANPMAMSAEERQQMLLTQPVEKIIPKMALPTICSMLITSIYNMADTYFVSQIGTAEATASGTSASAAVGIVFSVMAMIQALAFMFGMGSGTNVSHLLGMGKRKEAEVYSAVGFFSAVAAGVLIAVLGNVFNEPLMRLLGATETAMPYALDYARYIFLAAPFMMGSLSMNNLLRFQGLATYGMVGIISGGLLNMLLDPLLIFVCHFGMAGAAIATVAGQALTAGLSIWYLTRMKQIHLQKDSFRPRAHLLGKCAKLGMTSFLAQISLVAAMAATNTMLRICSAQDAVFSQEEFSAIPMAVFGIVMKVFQIVISCAIGLAAGCIPVAGYNMGAGRYDRVKGLLTRLLAAEAVVGLIALLVVELLPDQVMLLFGAQNESIHYTLFARRCFRVYLSMIVLACINKGTFIFLQSLGKAAASTLLSMAREIVFGVGLVLLLPQFFQLDGVIYSMPAADVLTAILSAVVLVRTYRSLETEK